MGDISQSPDPSELNIPGPNTSAGITEHEKSPRKFQPKDAHPSGTEGYGLLMMVLRGFAFAVYFATTILA